MNLFKHKMIKAKMHILVFILTIFIYCTCITECSPSLQRLELPSGTAGPDSFTFDIFGNGPYTPVSDGRILKYRGPNIGFVDYAFISPNRTKAICDGTNNTITFGLTCGRPLGFEFYYLTGELYVVDAFYGLNVVRPGGGLATQLATSANGVPFAFPVSLDVDQLTGSVYFTDGSTRYGLNQINELILTGDSTGRLLRYNPRTRVVTVLLSGLAGPAGIALSKNRRYILITEFVKNRILKYWLEGPKTNTTEILVNLTGSPNKIDRTKSGDFWVAVNVQTPSFALIGQRIDGFGNILETITFTPHFDTSLFNEVNEYKGALYLGSLYGGYVGVYNT